MHANRDLAEVLARGFRYQKLLDAGRCASISEMAPGERIERGYLGTLLRLMLLALDIVEAALSGRCAELPVALALGPFPVEWERQRLVLLDGDQMRWPPRRCLRLHGGSTGYR